jgi:hypothetical protein
MPKEQRDFMMSADSMSKVGKASFGTQKSIPGKNNNEWYVLEAMHTLKILVRVSGEVSGTS